MALSTVDREIFVCGSLRVLNFRLIFFARTNRRKFNAPKINSRRARVRTLTRIYGIKLIGLLFGTLEQSLGVGWN